MRISAHLNESVAEYFTFCVFLCFFTLRDCSQEVSSVGYSLFTGHRDSACLHKLSFYLLYRNKTTSASEVASRSEATPHSRSKFDWRLKAQQADIIVDSGRIQLWIRGTSVFSSLLSTAKKKSRPVPLSTPPKTHWPSTLWPRLYLRFPNFD